jgi:NAD(P)-dependent dehydrogenase (short-subunit alcohol dehydrogenase family)
MGTKKVWLITGAGPGLGLDIAKAALAAGHAVVATLRKSEQPSACMIACWRSASMSRIHRTVSKRLRLASRDLDVSTCW